MRIVQIIDSLDAGGAEKMAVNYANELSNKIAFSGLVVSRSQGQLINQLDKKVNYLYLNKKRTIDVLAIYKLVKFVKKNKIEIVHAHSTSFFLGFLIKIFVPSLKLIWHDHYGDSDFLHKRPATILLFIIRFYDGAIVVNNKLELWAKNKLNAKNIIYLPNFPSEEFATNSKTVLKGTSGKRIEIGRAHV